MIFGKMILAGEDSFPDHFRSEPESAENREKSVRDDLINRLRSVCQDLPEQEFQDLVAAMTREQLRSERLH